MRGLAHTRGRIAAQDRTAGRHPQGGGRSSRRRARPGGVAFPLTAFWVRDRIQRSITSPGGFPVRALLLTAVLCLLIVPFVLADEPDPEPVPTPDNGIRKLDEAVRDTEK